MQQLKFSILLILSLTTTKALAQLPQFSKTDTLRIPYDDAVKWEAGGDYLCGLPKDRTTESWDYYHLKGTDSLVYAVQYRDGKLYAEGLMGLLACYESEYPSKCWVACSEWKYYDEQGTVVRTENLRRKAEELSSVPAKLEFVDKFKVVWVK